MIDSFESSPVVITGASRGIGRVIAATFARKTTHPLILMARSENDLNVTKKLCEKAGPQKICVITGDLTKSGIVKKMTLPDDFATPSILINNAGSFLLKPLKETTYEDFINQIKDNLLSAVLVVNHFLEDLIKRDRGLIINICSAGSLEGLAESGAYASSKHALLGYTRSLRKELLKTNVGVTALNLGQTQSTSWEGSSVDPERLIDPQDVADLLVAISKISARSVTEEIILKPQHGRVPPM